MKFYEEYLLENDFEVEYFEDESYFKTYKNSDITVYDVVDNYLEKKLHKNFSSLKTIENPNFLNPKDESKFLHTYYKNRRKELNLFVKDNKPFGGKWSFDEENRKKMPKDEFQPQELVFENRFVIEAKQYCKKFDSIGSCDDFYYPTIFD